MISNKKRYDILSTFDIKTIKKELGESYKNLGEVHAAQVKAFEKLSASEKAADLKSTEKGLSRIGRPKMGAKPRVKTDTTVSAETMETIERLKRPGESRGQVIDRAIEALKKEEKSS